MGNVRFMRGQSVATGRVSLRVPSWVWAALRVQTQARARGRPRLRRVRLQQHHVACRQTQRCLRSPNLPRRQRQVARALLREALRPHQRVQVLRALAWDLSLYPFARSQAHLGLRVLAMARENHRACLSFCSRKTLFTSFPFRLGRAWTLPPVQPIAEPTVPSSTTAVSFADIQRMQALQGTTTPKDKRSLRDIQEEERAQQQEADFLKWWAAEEERVRLETVAQEQERVVGARTGTHQQNKERGGKAKTRKPKAEQPPTERNRPGGVGQQRESYGHRKPRQKESQ